MHPKDRRLPRHQTLAGERGVVCPHPSCLVLQYSKPIWTACKVIITFMMLCWFQHEQQLQYGLLSVLEGFPYRFAGQTAVKWSSSTLSCQTRTLGARTVPKSSFLRERQVQEKRRPSANVTLIPKPESRIGSPSEQHELAEAPNR